MKRESKEKVSNTIQRIIFSSGLIMILLLAIIRPCAVAQVKTDTSSGGGFPLKKKLLRNESFNVNGRIDIPYLMIDSCNNERISLATYWYDAYMGVRNNKYEFVKKGEDAYLSKETGYFFFKMDGIFIMLETNYKDRTNWSYNGEFTKFKVISVQYYFDKTKKELKTLQLDTKPYYTKAFDIAKSISDENYTTWRNRRIENATYYFTKLKSKRTDPELEKKLKQTLPDVIEENCQRKFTIQKLYFRDNAWVVEKNDYGQISLKYMRYVLLVTDLSDNACYAVFGVCYYQNEGGGNYSPDLSYNVNASDQWVRLNKDEPGKDVELCTYYGSSSYKYYFNEIKCGVVK